MCLLHNLHSIHLLCALLLHHLNLQMVQHYCYGNMKRTHTRYNESTAGADASVEVPKLHNIKLLIASFYTHIDYNYHD